MRTCQPLRVAREQPFLRLTRGRRILDMPMKGVPGISGESRALRKRTTLEDLDEFLFGETDKENQAAGARTTLEDLNDFLCGQADEETRRRIGKLLRDPTSRLRQFVESARQRAEDVTGWTGTDDGNRG